MGFEIDKEELYELYITKNLSALEIAEKFKTTECIIRKRLAKYSIKKDKAKCLEKVKESNLKKYGVENVSQLKEVKEKKTQKAFEKYGVSNISKAEEIKQKKTKSSFKKYGVANVLQAEVVKKKIEKTNLKLYKVKNPSSCKEIQKKREKTNLKRYGSKTPLQNPKVKNKIKRTNYERYGFEIASKNPKVIEKIKKTNRKKYGADCFLASDIGKKKIKLTCEKKYNVSYFCMTKKCREANNGSISKINKNFSKKLKDNNINNELEFSIGNYSYDIKIPDRNILIEINPTYTHNITNSAFFRNHKKKKIEIDYHKNKTLNAIQHGYKCIHIWDWDNIDKIINLLSLKQRIYARDCEIKEITIEMLSDFENKYHLQGYCNNQNIKIGLFYLGNLVQIMTFGKPRYNRNYEYELIRLCSHANYRIVGGATKLFKYFLNKYKPKNIISYCDNSKFDGEIYIKLGFVLEDYGKPSKHWYNPKLKRHITDNLLRQRGFDQLFNTNYGKGTNNKQLMIENGFVEIYDAGQSTYIYNN